MIYIRFVRIIILYQNIPGILYIFNHQIYITYTRIYIYKYVTTFIYLKDKNRYIIFIYKLLYFTLLILSHGFSLPLLADASRLNSSTTVANASGLIPFSVKLTNIDKVSLSKPVSNILDISCNTFNVSFISVEFDEDIIFFFTKLKLYNSKPKQIKTQ